MHMHMQDTPGILQTLCVFCRDKDPELQTLIAQAISTLIRGDQVRSDSVIPPALASRTASTRATSTCIFHRHPPHHEPPQPHEPHTLHP